MLRVVHSTRRGTQKPSRRAASPYTFPVPLTAFLELIAFVLGLVFGSFLNVCISRLPRGESVVKPRSHCPQCGHAVRWWDNLPLVSFVLLRAKCRDCGGRISWRYPAVELAAGLWFAAVAWLGRSEFRAILSSPSRLLLEPEGTLALLSALTLGFLLIGLAVMDWETLRLPDAFTLSGIGIGFFLVCLQAMFLPSGTGDVVLNTTHQLRLSSPGSFAAQGNVFLTGPETLVFGRLGAMALMACLLLLIRWAYTRIRGREGMGLGDVKLIAMIAAFLGLWQTLLALFVGVIAAAIFGLGLLARGRAGLTSRLPFGSFLCAGGLLAALVGQRVIDWYSGLLR